MSDYYSTEASIKAKVRASRVTLWADKTGDGVIDPETLTQALSWAKSNIDVRLTRRYGQQVLAWDSEIVPTLLKHISDDFTLYYLATGANAVNPVIQLNYDNSFETLTSLQMGELDLDDLSDYSDDIQTEPFDSVFDDFREKYNMRITDENGDLL